jgi:hypothetical protein
MVTIIKCVRIIVGFIIGIKVENNLRIAYCKKRRYTLIEVNIMSESKKDKISPVSIRLSADGRERLNRLQKISGCNSQKEFIEILMQLYETSGMQKLGGETVSSIKLIIQSNNWITDNLEKQYCEPKVLSFDGICIYVPKQINKLMKLSSLSTDVINDIIKDYYLPDNILLDSLLIQDTINVYYSYSNKKYIFLEYFCVFQCLNENEILSIYKAVSGSEVGNMLISKCECYEVNRFSEFVKMKKSYMYASDLINADFAIKNYELNTKTFS